MHKETISKIEEHPLYLLINKLENGLGPNNYPEKIIELIPSIKQNHFNKQTVNYLRNLTVNFINEQWIKRQNMSDYFGSKINNKDILNVYEQLLVEDQKKESLVWTPRTLVTIDSVACGREFLDLHYPSIFKQNIYKQAGAEYLSSKFKDLPNLGKYDLESSFVKKAFENVSALIDRYGEKYIDWNKSLIETPSLALALLAKSYGYELKKEHLHSVFHHTKDNIVSSSFHSEESVKRCLAIAQEYNNLLIESVFFKNSLAPAKNVHISLAKFLGVSLDFPKEKRYSSRGQEFIEAVVLSKDYDVVNYEIRLQRKSYYKTMGKYILNSEEKEIYNKIIEEKQSVAPKKHKI